jgi:phage terminase large subunit
MEQGTSQYKFKNGSIVEFFAADNAGKALGSARDYLFINECNNVNYEIAFQLIARTNKRTFLDFNPVSEFWAHTEIMQNDAFQVNGIIYILHL